jgi:futalosine hydrolase
VTIASCGVGVARSGARTARLLAELRPERVVLAGLAGSFDVEALPPGALLSASLVKLHGVGVGEGAAHLSLAEAGGALAAEAAEGEGPLELLEPAVPPGAFVGGLLTACSGSATPEQALLRSERHPSCVAEDMESWPVAAAAQEAGVPLTVLRAVSNAAGDRDHGRWALDEAFEALRGALEALTEPLS